MAGQHRDQDPAWPLEFWIDRGGTFTDVLARDGLGRLSALKLLSEHPAYTDAASEGVRRMLGLQPRAPIPKAAIGAVKMGTTVATNALLEGKGAKTLFLVTGGFADLLSIGDQTRPDIFALHIERPAPLPARTVEIGGRISAAGEVIEALDHAALDRALAAARADGFQAVAIAFLNAYSNDAHETIAERAARAAGFDHVTASNRASASIKLVPRASTAVIDAYLEPVLRDYVGRVEAGLEGTKLYFMQSSGGLARADAFQARNAVLSGPAGGVVGMARTAREAGYDQVIGFDMGGTSTDVSRVDGERYELVGEAQINGRKLRAPMLSVHTVAAGGGSILSFDGERARVGPHSAGADPGPACYGRGGPAALTDANLVLGRISPGGFARVFGPDQDQPLDAEASHRRLAELAEAMGADSAESAAEGFLAVAVEAMAQAIKQISTGQGVDPREYALNAFGGAGGQHACKVADALGMRTVLIHPQAGLLSAYGIGLSPLSETREHAIEKPFDEAGLASAREALSLLEAAARASLERQGGVDIETSAVLRLRARGSDTALSIAFDAPDAMRAGFHNDHERLFGFTEADAALVIETASVNASARPAGDAPTRRAASPANTAAGAPTDAQIFHDGAWRPARQIRFTDLTAEREIHGPAIILDTHQTVVVDAGWKARLNAHAMLVMEQVSARAVIADETLDPVRLELFNRRFMAIAEQMGVVLERTAHSVNIKERLDFSCAVFDAEGGLVANAPHMPVHLGSMSASVRAAMDAHPDLGPGDAVAVNAPYNGGTHLPDVTVITPVCAADGTRLFFTASRGHHADIGGIEPGSMPPFSRTIEEEGVLFDSVEIVKGRQFQDAAVRAVLASGAHPARNPDQNVADLKAQLAACETGARELAGLIERFGLKTVRAYMEHVQDNAERAVRRVIGALSDGEAQMHMDDGAVIKVAITVDQGAGEAVIDFTGTSAQKPDNFNAPASVARAAVLYVLRCLVQDQIPLNEGCLKPIRLIIPDGCLLNPRAPAAVVAGNVETSQLVVDALFAATGRLSSSQGTMNNFTFGNTAHQYYETICGGAGAGLRSDGSGFDGAAAVHTHMTNSRLTDPEVLEARFPVRVIEHRVRRASGGRGAFRGGDGSVRRLEFLEPMTANLLSGRRSVAPPGLAGGGDGAPGEQRLIRTDGRVEVLPALFTVNVGPGDQIEIETPGGGGLGDP
ncbi:MAG: hydantoinase B/oxoprolinase family protein [Pseudomonadota bacterium]